MRLGCALPLLLLLTVDPAGAADGDLDLSFWSDGTYLDGSNIGDTPLEAVPEAAVTAPNGRLVVVGTAIDGGVNVGFWRTVDDASAGTPCLLAPNGSALAVRLLAAAFDPQGRLLVGGSFAYADGARLGLARYLYPGCTLDPSFDGNGRWALDIPDEGTSGEHVTDVAVSSAGLIGLVGTVDGANGVPGDMVIGLLTDAGALVPAFAGTGWRVFDATGFGLHDVGSAIAWDEPARLLVAGSTAYGFNTDWTIAAFNFDGSLDESFGSGGQLRLGFDLTTNGTDSVAELVREADTGKLLIVGTAHGSSTSSAAVARLTATGGLDSTFAGTGTLTLPLATSNATGRGLAVDGRGRILVSGSRENDEGVSELFVARLTPGGALDGSFSGDGWTSIPFIAGIDQRRAEVGALTLCAGRPTLAAAVSSVQLASWRMGAARVETSLIFADGFESGWTGQWALP